MIDFGSLGTPHHQDPHHTVPPGLASTAENQEPCPSAIGGADDGKRSTFHGGSSGVKRQPNASMTSVLSGVGLGGSHSSTAAPADPSVYLRHCVVSKKRIAATAGDSLVLSMGSSGEVHSGEGRGSSGTGSGLFHGVPLCHVGDNSPTWAAAGTSAASWRSRLVAKQQEQLAAQELQQLHVSAANGGDGGSSGNPFTAGDAFGSDVDDDADDEGDSSGGDPEDASD